MVYGLGLWILCNGFSGEDLGLTVKGSESRVQGFLI
jgi:hypothetical protein